MQRLAHRLLGALVALLACGNVLAHNESAHSSPIRFIQNKGQWEPQVLFAADIPSGRIFLERDRLTYAFCNTSDLHQRMFERLPGQPEDSMLDCHAFTVRFAGAQSPEEVHGEDQSEGIHNYYIGNNPAKWASNVPRFERIHYKNLYPGIDFVIYATGRSIKYDFVVQPGTDPSVIKLVYDGLDGLKLNAGELVMQTSLFDVKERKPIAYQHDAPLACAFDLKGNALGFRFPEGFRANEELVIDPTLVFSTFTGSMSDNFGFSATYDDQENLYAGGIAFSQGYPVTTGAYQTTFRGAVDVSITKLSTTGAHMYSTYLGGSNRDQPHSMVVDPFGNLVVFGMTQSSDFPTASSTFDNTLSGSSDIYITKLSPNGSSLMASTLVGGDGWDAYNINSMYTQSSLKYNYGDDARGEVVVDDQGFIYVAACTQSGNFPVSNNAFQQQPNSAQDGVVFKMNPALTLMEWGTLLGGNNDDAAYSLKVASDYSVYVVGGTRSSNFPTTPGTIAPNQPGGIDGFVTHLNDVGSGLVASTYIGTSNYNQCYFVEIDGDGDVYITGQKLGNIPNTPGTYGNGSGGQFIQKLTPSLNSVIYQFSFGTSNTAVNLAPTAFLVDVCEYVYVSGWGGTTNFTGNTFGMPTTFDGQQLTTDGSDLYLVVFETDGVALDYATFMGGSLSNEHVDGGTSRFSKNAQVYQAVCAGCWSNSDFPTTPGAFSNTNNSSGCNLACFKMDLELPGIAAAFQPVPGFGGCAPHSVQFQNQSQGGISYTWSFGDPGSGNNSATSFNASHVYQNPGSYTVMLVAQDPNSCNGADTSYRTITVYPVPVLQLSPDTSSCEGTGVPLTASGGANYAWSPPTGLSNTSGTTTVSDPPSTTTYTVIVTNPGGCADTGQVTVTVLPAPTADAGTGGFICPGDSLQLSASGGIGYQWSSPGTLNNSTSPTPIAFPTQTTTYTVTVLAPNGCTDADTVTVQVSIVQAQPGPDLDLCIGESAQLNASGGGSYQWQPPTGLSSTTIPNPVANPTVTTTYSLTVTNSIGCEHTEDLIVTVHPLPTVSLGPDLVVLCENDSLQLQATGALTYAWSPPTALSNPNISNPFAYPTTTTSYVVLGTDIYGCEDTDTLRIDVLPAPQAVAWGGIRICQDSSLRLYGSGGGTYEWYPPQYFDNPNSPTPIVTLSQDTTLTLRVVGANGCDDRDTVFIPVTAAPEARIVGPPTVCSNEQVILLASGGDTYVWSTGETTLKIFVYPQRSDLYTVVTYRDGCPSKPDSIYLEVDTILPIADFWADPDSGILPLATTFFNQSLLSTSWEWDFGDGNGSTAFSPSHVFQDTGRYWVRLIAYTGNGCRDTAYHKIIVGADFTIYVPTAFTPNDDGLNDGFSVKWIGVKEFHVMLFDRWGMMIYESFDPNFSWDGTLHGLQSQEGVYTYVIEASGHLNEKVKRAGTVTLMR